ncbi:solute carrier family 35 member E2-like [Limulus polyphemus]|uniref:Solute carrier family 35 member E2-like n=1 Tax=Limulus polyphemus TaxID=6850 RepID=A0ABM1BY00_LIMPO|nr:solute carrier family 35 member E2-like [Limulus polyphemus]
MLTRKQILGCWNKGAVRDGLLLPGWLSDIFHQWDKGAIRDGLLLPGWLSDIFHQWDKGAVRDGLLLPGWLSDIFHQWDKGAVRDGLLLPGWLSDIFHQWDKGAIRDGLLLPDIYSYNKILITTRYSTILLGLIALWYVPVSFAETVKSSAPVFTVIVAWIFMGEKTNLLVIFSLFPVMGGLVLCSANELSFKLAGFLASLATNLSECMQNVYSKILLSNEKHNNSPSELQFYTSITSLAVQVPACLLLIDFPLFYSNLNKNLIIAYLLDGVSFHCQSITEYTLLGYISPVTHSVANTAKRALLIWLSVLTFGNPVTPLSALGTVVVILGVFLYNKARNWSVKKKSSTPVSHKSSVHSA